MEQEDSRKDQDGRQDQPNLQYGKVLIEFKASQIKLALFYVVN